MRTIRIDKVRTYLEKGYELSISTNHITDKSEGSLILILNNKIIGIEEVDIDEFMNFFPNIKRNLIYQICILKYDIQKGKVINSIKQKVYNGVYNEECFYQVVDGLQVEANDVFSSFIYQEEKIKNYVENNGKVIKKEKVYGK